MKVAVGYGLDVTGMNLDGLRGENRYSKESLDPFIEEVRAYAQEHDDLREKVMFHPNQMAQTEKHLPGSISEMVIRDDEFAFKDKLLLIPFGYTKSWYRSSNLLDAFQYEAYRHFTDPDFNLPEWREKPGTLYPFVNLMRANPASPLGVEDYWHSCYLNDERYKDAIPAAPRHLWILIKHLKLVPDEQVTETFLKLRPTFMRWWS